MKNKNSISASLLFISAFAIALFFITCKKEKDNEDETIASATITGKVIAKNKNTPIGSAQIIAGNYTTRTDKDGLFSLAVKPGSYHLIIQTGKGNLFKTEMDITVSEGQVLALSGTATVLKQVGSMAYIAGSYDKIETIINDSLGYSAIPITVMDLDNDSLLNTFDAIFLNCGALSSGQTMDSARYMHLGNFYQNGGSIYASDFAVDFLTGDGHWRPALNNTSPRKNTSSHESHFSIMSTCITPMLGGFINDSSLCSSKSGPAGLITNIDILVTDLITALGKDSIDINYDLGGWEIISLVDAPFEIIMQNNNANAPSTAVAVRTTENKNTGVIYYTTFHNEPQGGISPDVQKVLEFFILNL